MVGLVVVGYVGGAYIAWKLLATSDFGTAFYAPAGVSVATLILSPRRRWLMVIVAAMVADTFVSFQLRNTPMWCIPGFSVATAVEALVGASIVRQFIPNLDLARVKHLMVFTVGAIVAGPLAGAVIRGFTVRMSEGTAFTETMLLWWLEGSLGTIIVGGLILAMVASDGRRFLWKDFGTILAATTALAIVLHWWTSEPVGFILIIPLIVLSARVGVRAASAGAALMTFVAVTAWIRVDGFVAAPATGSGIVLIKLQILTMAIAALFVAAESSELEAVSLKAGERLRSVQLLRSALAPDREVRAAHVEAEGFSRSASPDLEVGGDWYDVSETEDGMVSIIIGDVAGHGEEALVMMGRLRFAAQALVMLGRDAGHVLDWLAEFGRRSEGGAFATCLVAYFDPSTGELNYASAGHPPALLGTSDGNWRWLTEGRSTPIGVPFPNPRGTARLMVEDTATLVVYTDGVVERAGEVIDTGMARMFDAVTGAQNGSVEQMMGRVATTTADDASFVRIRLKRQ